MKCVVRRSKCGGPQFILLFTGTAVKNVHAAAVVRMASSLSEKKRERGRLFKRSAGVDTNTKAGINKEEEIKNKNVGLQS